MANKPRVYIDSCCFIELARVEIDAGDPDREKDVWCLRRILDAQHDDKLQILTSTLSIAECQHADGAATEEIRTLFNKLLTSGQYVILIQDTILVAERARDLRWVHEIQGVKGADAIHIASAMEFGCNEFLTFDGKIHDKASAITKLGLDVIYPRDYQNNLPPEYLQQNLEEYVEGQTNGPPEDAA